VGQNKLVDDRFDRHTMALGLLARILSVSIHRATGSELRWSLKWRDQRGGLWTLACVAERLQLNTPVGY